MTSRKRILAAVTGLVTMAAIAAPAAAEPLKIGLSAEPYPPFTYKGSDGGWTGFEVELGKAICAEMDAECVITPTSWSGIIPALNSGKIDMIMNSMSITEDRDKVIDFTDPYYYTSAAFVAEKDRGLDIPEGLDGLTLGVQGATTHAAYAREELDDTGVRIRIYDEQEQANRDLMAGRLDVIMADQIAMGEFVERDEAQAYEIKDLAPRHPAFGEGIGIGIREDDDELEDNLNAAIGKVLNDGTCTELSEQYFGQDICGA